MSYQNLDVWRAARGFARDVYDTTRDFPRSEMFGLMQQLRRGVVSIASNIAEGQGRWTHAEQVRFYYMARGSLLEVETQLYIAHDLGYIGAQLLSSRLEASSQIGRMLNGLIKSRKPEPRAPGPEA